VAQPVEIFGPVKGMTRDFGVDSLPNGYLWDLVDSLPNRKGARVEQRGNWNFFPQATVVDYGGVIYGGAHVRFLKGTKLLVNANSRIFDVDLSSGAKTDIGPGPVQMLQNGVMLRDRVYFFDWTGTASPTVVTWTAAAAVAAAVASAPKAKVGIAYKERLAVGGVAANPGVVYFSPLETEGTSPNFGPLGTWDAASFIGTSQEVTGLAGMSSQILVFHPGMIERIRGSEIDTTAGGDGDMYVETLTDQIGCTMPHTIVPWRESIIFADEHGVFLTDGATVRNLAELGGIGDFWRIAYGSRIPGSTINCGIFLDYLLVTINTTDGSVNTPHTLVCDLNERAWMRFTNFPSTCFIPSTADTEESYCGHLSAHRLMKTSTMFQDPIPVPTPPPDYVDGDGRPVLASLTTGFKRLAKEEGMQRVRGLFVSYQSVSDARAPEASAIQVEYRMTPPRSEGLDIGGAAGWLQAGFLPDGGEYSRKKLPTGKRGYGVMVRLSSARATRTTRFFSIGVERTSQDRAKVTT
jgi:hypothetical protein